MFEVNFEFPQNEPIEADFVINATPSKTSQLINDSGFITSEDVGNGTITIVQGEETKGTFTVNQSGNTTITLDEGGGGDVTSVNGQTGDVVLNATDVGALPSTTTINNLTTTSQQNALNSGATTTNIGQITTNKNNITNIQNVIPSQATSSNQLADKNFVNSSIATNTANFIGTFNSVAELEAYSGTLTNNDYAFVVGTDTAGNTVYNRYKYTTATTPAGWEFEYALNNSSFTADQWAAINSGVTSSTVSTAESALQPNDNISELINNAGYITSSDIPVTSVNGQTGAVVLDAQDVGALPDSMTVVSSVNNVSPVNGNVTLSIPVDSDLVHKAGVETITGSKTFKEQQLFQSGSASGCVVIGADSGATTVTANTRKLGRMTFHTNESTTLNCAFVSTDTQSATGSGIENCVEFGGRTGDQTSTSPDTINFTVAKTHNTITPAQKQLALTINKDKADFSVQPKYNGTNLATTSDIKNGKLTITQGGVTKGTFTANASSNVTIDLDAGGGGSSLNVGTVIPSTIPLTDAGYHLLDGGVLQRGSYADFVDYMADLYNSEQTVSDINIIGTLTDNSGVISGFSADNFALLPFDKSLTSASSWEFVIGFNVDNWQTGQVLLGYKQFGSGRYKSPQVYLHNQYIELSLSSNGTSWDIADDVYSTYTLSANTDYLMKLKFTGSAYIVEISSDNGSNWTTYTTVNSSTKCYGLVGTSLGCGGGGGAMLPYTGTIDLTKTYFNIDGSRIWNGVMPKDFCSEDAWQASITAYGVCDKYVYDSENNTVRLPKYGNQIYTDVTTNPSDCYYYVVIANSVKTQIEVDIDQIATDLNGKVSKADCETIYPVIAEYVYGTEGCRIWSGGYCEQWGYISTGAGNKTIALLKEYNSPQYPVTFTIYYSGNSYGYYPFIGSSTATGFTFNTGSDAAYGGWWKTSGYLKAGEY